MLLQIKQTVLICTVDTSFGSGIMNVKRNSYGNDEVEIKRDKGDKL